MPATALQSNLAAKQNKPELHHLTQLFHSYVFTQEGGGNHFHTKTGMLTMWFNHSSPRSSPKRNETICAYEEPAMTIPRVICKNPNLEITRTSVNRQKDKHRCTSHTKESESTGRMYCWHTETLMDHKVTFFFFWVKEFDEKGTYCAASCIWSSGKCWEWRGVH